MVMKTVGCNVEKEVIPLNAAAKLPKHHSVQKGHKILDSIHRNASEDMTCHPSS